MGAFDYAGTVVVSSGLCRRRRWERDDHRSVRWRLAFRSFGEVLAERVGRREQEREKPSLPPGGPGRSPERAAVLNAKDCAVERDRDVVVLTAAHTWEQRQAREGETDPHHAHERRRRGQARRLEGRQKPRSRRGPCRCSPQILHVRQPQILQPQVLVQTSAISGPKGVPHPRE
jgi:hypothetical protein